jgi:hypothetical protein
MPVPNQTLMTQEESDKLEMYKDGNYRPGMYEEGPSLDRAYRSGGIIDHVQSSGTTLTFNSSPSFTTYTYNPETFNISSAGSVGIGTTTTSNAQISVTGDVAINNGDLVFRTDGVERARYTSEGLRLPEQPEPPQEYHHFDSGPSDYEQQLYNELNEVRFDRDEPAEDARWRLEQMMASRMAEANERVAEKHLSLLDNIELGTLDNDMKIKMQMLAGIKTTQQRIQEMDDHIKQLRSEEAQPEVVHSSIWNKIKNTGAKLGRRFTNRSRKQIGALPMSVSARLEAVKQSQEQ